MVKWLKDWNEKKKKKKGRKKKRKWKWKKKWKWTSLIFSRRGANSIFKLLLLLVEVKVGLFFGAGIPKGGERETISLILAIDFGITLVKTILN